MTHFLNHAADLIDGRVDLAAVEQLAQPPPNQPSVRESSGNRQSLMPPLGQRIALASDRAFAFAYPHLLDGWRDAGAEIVPFSPLADEAPVADADAVYLPGGYPELHAGRLAACTRFSDGLRGAAERGARIYGECGGYMVLGEWLLDETGTPHRMAGLLPLTTSLAAPALSFGYRALILQQEGPLGSAGTRFRGHEFHYATLQTGEPDTPLFTATDVFGERSAPIGHACGNVMGSFIHLVDRADKF